MLYAVESKLCAMNTSYGERLETALRLAKMDRQDLADKIGISVQAVGQVIAGKTKALTAENSMKAARALGVDGYWLATGEGEPTIAESAAVAENGWPFGFPRSRYERLSVFQRTRLEGVLEGMILAWEADEPKKSKGSAA